MNFWRLCIVYMLILFGVVVFFLASGCTHGAEGSKISHQPALIFCVLSNCETELADRTSASVEQEETSELEVTPLP